MNKDVLEGNKLIAEFMELKPTEWGGMYSISQDHCTCRESTPEKALDGFASIAKYHESWDWLMPIVERVENLDFGKWYVHIQGNTVDIEDGNEGVGLWDFHINNEDPVMSLFPSNKSLKPIEAVFMAVVEFIKWYNKNKNQ